MVFTLRFNMVDGCYYDGSRVERVIRFPGSKTLEEVCITLMASLDFDYDHLYEFTIGKRRYAGSPMGTSGERCVQRLDSLGLRRGGRFRLWYDFGDDWMFDITVLEITDETRRKVEVISSTGRILQYPDPEGDWDDDGPWDDDGDWDEDGDWDDGDEWDEDAVEWDYIPSDALLDLAFAMKKAKPWKKLTEGEMIACRFSDKQVGYISVMGMNGEHCAAAVYPGAKGLESFWQLSNPEPDSGVMTPEEFYARCSCMQLILDNKQFLRDEEVSAVQAYAARNDIRLSGKNAFPHFIVNQPSCMPWYPDAKQEQYLKEAAQAILYVMESLKTQDKETLDIREIDFAQPVQNIPLITMRKSGPAWDGYEMVFAPGKPMYPSPAAPDDITAAKLKRFKKKTELEVSLKMIMHPVITEPGTVPKYPWVLITADVKARKILDLIQYRDPSVPLDELAKAWLEQLVNEQCRPALIRVDSPRAEAFVKPAAEVIGCRVEIAKTLDCMDELMQMYMQEMMQNGLFPEDDEDGWDEGGPFDDDFDPEDMSEEEYIEFVADLIAEMPQSMVRQMPKALKDEVRELLDAGIFPPDIEAKIRKKLK